MSQEDRLPHPTVSSVVDPLHVVEVLAALESRFRHVFRRLLSDTDFLKKYDFGYKDAFDGALFYVFTAQPTPVSYIIEAFPVVHDQPTTIIKRIGELTYHWMFEDVIERYTQSRRKPNPVLVETRSGDFCYLLTIKIEAISLEKARRPTNFMLLREFQILQHIWENYRSEFINNKCNTDQLIGFPMPFEFKNIDSTEFDLSQGQHEDFRYYSPSGKLEPLHRVNLSSFGSVSEMRSIKSTLSYMSLEKVGPSLDYLMDLMMSEGKCFTVSSALKVYDQLISRLMIMHKYSVIHGDVSPSALSFGTGEAVNVLYINSFDSALVTPTGSPPLPYFHDRFVAHGRMKEKNGHFVHDLESAFYVLLYLLLGRLPWDSRLVVNEQDSLFITPVGIDISPNDVRTEKSRTVEDKEKFWQSSSQILWLGKSIDMEFKDTMYRNFTCDIVESIYAKVKESIATCQLIGQAAYVKDIFIPGSAPYNAYFGIRKIIASYFRFESRTNSLRDPVWSTKVGILLKEGVEDRRMPWDMSLWCWNYLDTSVANSQLPGTAIRSAMATR